MCGKEREYLRVHAWVRVCLSVELVCMVGSIGVVVLMLLCICAYKCTSACKCVQVVTCTCRFCGRLCLAVCLVVLCIDNVSVSLSVLCLSVCLSVCFSVSGLCIHKSIGQGFCQYTYECICQCHLSARYRF